MTESLQVREMPIPPSPLSSLSSEATSRCLVDESGCRAPELGVPWYFTALSFVELSSQRGFPFSLSAPHARKACRPTEESKPYCNSLVTLGALRNCLIAQHHRASDIPVCAYGDTCSVVSRTRVNHCSSVQGTWERRVTPGGGPGLPACLQEVGAGS